MNGSTLRRHRRRLAAAAVTLAVIAAGCGARLPSAVRSQAANAVLKTGENHGGTAVPSAGPVTPGAPVASGHAPQPGQTAPTIPVPNGPGQPTTSRSEPPVASNRPTGSRTCPGSGTDVGLTSNSLTLGTVATLTGPVAGLFQGAVQGTESYASYVNATQGGICGRQLHVDTADDATNCTQNQNVTQSLIGRVFALVGSFSLYDGCGATVIAAHPAVPDVHVALDPAAETPKNHFDLSAGEPGYATGMFHYYAMKYGAAVKDVGTIIEDIPSAIANQDNMEHSAESQGWKFTSSFLEAPTNSDFEGDFVKMCVQQKIKLFFLLTETAQNAATIMRDERQAGCPKSLINVFPIAYDQGFIPDYGGSVSDLNGIQGWSEYALFYNTDEAANLPALKALQSWFARDYPGQSLNLYAMYAWVSDMLFQQAFENAGPVANRNTVLAALRRIKNFNGGGILSPRDPGSAAGVHCYILWQLENGKFERIDDPKAGFRCDGQFLPRPGG